MTLQGLGHTPLFIPHAVSVLCVLRYVMLFVTITPLLRAMECSYHRQVCIVVLVVHLVLSVLAALVVCVMFCGAGSAPMCWLYVCVVVLGAHLVLSVLAALGICVMFCGAGSVPMCWLYVVLGAHLCVSYMWCWEHTYVLAICIVGCLAHTWCQRGVALVKFQTFSISYGVTGHICIL